MVRYLSRLRNKKGFTVVELVVVIAIIAVLAGLIIASMNDRDSNKIVEANTNAETFMTATQLAFTRIEYTERELWSDASSPIKYVDGKNVMLGDTNTSDTDFQYLFLEAYVTEHGIQYVHMDSKLTALMAESRATDMNALEKYVMALIQTGLAETFNGYFYAQVDSGFRVRTTHFSEWRLPVCADGMTAVEFHTSMVYTAGKKVNNRLVGYCSDIPELDKVSGYLYNAPSPATTEGGKYF